MRNQLPRGPGRPKGSTTGTGKKLTLTLPPDLYDWVQEKGGTKFVMKVLEFLRKILG